ncbi:MAG: mandelate racemase/muconate lactonizing enzyme family protein [Acidobacteria bacterium]|nr:mandelate racemase/muconate lactonizing enzyme family protein [Acidobacteriota bacterium]MBI3422040.1 mandelate racemase/muconate lactonizing enzyme family protein [Acidobacteriota bacterium]
MKITSITAYAVKIPRDFTTARGTAGSPTPLVESDNAYRWATSYPTIYSTRIETALIKITTDSGLIGWGEAQAPVAPEVVCTIIRTILAPLLLGENPLAHEKLWSLMYAAMRVRGHTTSFLVDAIAGIDMALWDIKGKALKARVCDLLGGPFKDELPAYISGLSGVDDEARIQQARGFQERGFTAFKLFMDGEAEATLRLIDSLRAVLGGQAQIFVDVLWRFDPARAVRFGKQLDVRGTGWFEAPLKPEDVAGHARLAESLETPIAIGESYRTRWEMQPFFAAGAVEIFQPDIGRSGITEGMKLSALAELHNVPIAFHVSIGLGVQIAAALHVAASIPNLLYVECNPQVWQVAESLLKTALPVGQGVVGIPAGAGLGVEIDEEKLLPFIAK